MSTKFEALKAYAKTLPQKPGVYRYYDNEDIIIYVGKAKNLKNRVSSYFQDSKNHSTKTQRLVRQIRRIEYTVVNTEYDALLLENNLIKINQPKYNIMLKDGKSYPCILITKERFPRILFSRNIDPKLGEYFGPYTRLSIPKILLELIQKTFFIRNCKYNLSEENIEAKKYKVCMEYHINNCLGPCEGLQIEADYLTKIEQARNILKGNISDAKLFIKNLMQEAAEKFEFEKADLYKQKLELLKAYQRKSEVVNPKLGNLAVFTITSTDKKAFVNYLLVQNGYIVSSPNFEDVERLDEDDTILLSFAIRELYESR